MSRDNRIQPILDDLAELKELLLVIDQTPSTPEILYKLAGEKAQALTDCIERSSKRCLSRKTMT